MRNDKYVVLCVDDDTDLLDWMKVVLESNNYIFERAFNAEQGRRKFKECKPDLIIVDLMMEEIDSGTALVKDLKVAGNTAPVYMLSSAGDNLATSIDYSELGLDGVFQKPLTPDYLLKVLAEKLK